MTYVNPYMLFTGSMIPNWLMRRDEISAGAKLTYARLCQYAGDHGVAWPAQQTLAKELGICERQLRTNIIRTDVLPGKVSEIRIVPDRVGTFDFHCDNFCGSGHESMAAVIVVEE